jgi:uncharacterized protein (TIGR02996 family)
MTDAGAFLQAIVEEPADDAVRLIFADWLDEHGDGDRADFIRAQIELADLPESHPRRPALQQLEQRLLGRHRDTWLGPLRSLAYAWKFVRGFPEEATLDARSFLEQTPLLFGSAPLRLVRLLKAGSLIDAVAGCSYLSRVQALHLTDNGIGNNGVLWLAQSPHLARLTALRLGRNQVGDSGVQALARSPYLTRLTALNLSCNHISSAGVAALAGAPNLAGLRLLHLGDNQIGPGGVEALLASPHLRQLTSLDLANSSRFGGNTLGPRQEKALRQRFGTAAVF